MGRHTTTSELQNQIVSTLNNATIPLSGQTVTENLRDNLQIAYSYRQVMRQLNDLLKVGRVEIVGKSGKTHLFTIPGKQLEPWESTSPPAPDPDRPSFRVNGYNFTPDALARSLVNTQWSILNEKSNTELRNQLMILVLGSSAYDVLKAHSIRPVADIRQPLEEFNDKLKALSKMIDSILSSELVKTGSSGNAISNQTRDNLIAELEDWLMNLSINKRSNIQ